MNMGSINLIKKILSTVLFLSIFSFLFFNILSNWSIISNYPWRFNIQDIVTILLLSTPVYFLNAFSWHLVTKSLGLKINFSENIKIWTFSNLGRFLPGGIWQYVGRGYLLQKAGLSKTQASVSIIVETLFILVVSSVVASTTLLYVNFPIKLNLDHSWWIAGVLLLISFLIIIDKVTNKKIFILIKKNLHVIKSDLKLSWGYLPIMLVLFALQFIIAGSILFFLSRGAVNLSLDLLPMVIGGYTLSWLLGYLTIFSPSGLGIQEVSIATFLTLFMPFPIASIVAILFRVFYLVLEFIFLLFVLVVIKPKS